MPFPERAIKDVVHFLGTILNFFKNGFKSKSIFVFPDYPSKKTSLFKVAKKLNFNLSNKLNISPDIVVYWEDVTHGFPEKLKEFKSIDNDKILNFYCNDISKEYVDAVFMKTFGYSTFIDPRTHNGIAVKKSDINAKHDGEIINCPIEKLDDEMIYQILIDNTISDKEVVDYRIPIVKTALDFVYLKYKNNEIRFDNITTRVSISEVSEIFSEEEISLINDFCKEIKLDFGELDILRDNNDKRIYIIDVNKTPYSPPADLNKEESYQVINKITGAFQEFI